MEMVSMVASVMILVANGVKNVKLMRTLFLIACVLFVAYGISIRSVSLVFLNGCSTLIHIYKLMQMKMVAKVA